MVKISFEIGDVFSFGERGDNFGLVIADGIALMFSGEGGRVERILRKDIIPASALPIRDAGKLDGEIQFAIQAVKIAMDIE